MTLCFKTSKQTITQSKLVIAHQFSLSNAASPMVTNILTRVTGSYLVRTTQFIWLLHGKNLGLAGLPHVCKMMKTGKRKNKLGLLSLVNKGIRLEPDIHASCI